MISNNLQAECVRAWRRVMGLKLWSMPKTCWLKNKNQKPKQKKKQEKKERSFITHAGAGCHTC